MFFVIPDCFDDLFYSNCGIGGSGKKWALNNQTYQYMNGWLPLCEALRFTGRLYWIYDDQILVGDREKKWFRNIPFPIVAINDLNCGCK